MTIQGTVAKTALLLAILSATAIWSWTQASRGGLNPAIFIGSAIGGFVVALVTIFRPTLPPYSAPLYAGLEGVFLGALSYFVEQQYYKGIAMQATSLTLATLLVMLFLYGTRLIRVTQKLAAGIVMATGAIALVYLISLLVNL